MIAVLKHFWCSIAHRRHFTMVSLSSERIVCMRCGYYHRRFRL